MLDRIIKHVQQTEELFSIVRQEPTHPRLLQLLIWLSQKFGREVDQGQLIELRITHQEIAEVLGTTRVTVTRLLKQFEQERIIARHGNRIVVLST